MSTSIKELSATLCSRYISAWKNVFKARCLSLHAVLPAQIRKHFTAISSLMCMRSQTVAFKKWGSNLLTSRIERPYLTYNTWGNGWNNCILISSCFWLQHDKTSSNSLLHINTFNNNLHSDTLLYMLCDSETKGLWFSKWNWITKRYILFVPPENSYTHIWI